MCGGLRAQNEGRAQLGTRRAQVEGGADAGTVHDAAGGHDGQAGPLDEQAHQHRAVAPPYPGAHTELGGMTLTLVRARLRPGRDARLAGLAPGLAVLDGAMVGVCGDGRMLAITTLRAGEVDVTAEILQRLLSRSTCAI